MIPIYCLGKSYREIKPNLSNVEQSFLKSPTNHLILFTTPQHRKFRDSSINKTNVDISTDWMQCLVTDVMGFEWEEQMHG